MTNNCTFHDPKRHLNPLALPLLAPSLCQRPQRMRPSLLFSVSFLSPCFFLYLLGSFEVTVTSVSLPPFVSRRGLSNTNHRLSLDLDGNGCLSHHWAGTLMTNDCIFITEDDLYYSFSLNPCMRCTGCPRSQRRARFISGRIQCRGGCWKRAGRPCRRTRRCRPPPRDTQCRRGRSA